MLASLFISTKTLSLLYPNRYEDEINRRTGAENEFVVLKKVNEWGVLGWTTKWTWRAQSSSKADGSWGPPASQLGQAMILARLGVSLGWVLLKPCMGITSSMPMELPCFLRTARLVAVASLLLLSSTVPGHIPMSQSFAFCPRTRSWLTVNVQCYIKKKNALIIAT